MATGSFSVHVADIAWVKKEMGRLLSRVRSTVEAGRLPSATDTQRLVELSADFNNSARPDWAEGSGEALDAAGELDAAVRSGDYKAAQAAVDSLLHIRKRYHDRFK